MFSKKKFARSTKTLNTFLSSPTRYRPGTNSQDQYKQKNAYGIFILAGSSFVSPASCYLALVYLCVPSPGGTTWQNRHGSEKACRACNSPSPSLPSASAVVF